MKKRILILGLLFILLFSSLAFAQEDQPSIFINGKSLDLEGQDLILKDDRYFLPFRLGSEDLGYKIKWNQEKRTILLTTESIKVLMEIDNPNYTINNLPKQMDVSPFIVNDRAYVPIRFIAEALGKEVLWKGEDRAIYINDKDFQGDPNLVKYLDKDLVFKNFLEEAIGSSVPRLAYGNSAYSVILNYNGILIIDNQTGKLKGAVDNRAIGYNLLQGDDYVKILGNEDNYLLIKKNSQVSAGYVYSIEDNKLKYYENTGNFNFQERDNVNLEEEQALLEKVDGPEGFSYSIVKYPQGLSFLEVNTNKLGKSKIRIFDQELNEIKVFELLSL